MVEGVRLLHRGVELGDASGRAIRLIVHKGGMLGFGGETTTLDITEGPVKLHVSSILGKLGAADRTEAVTRALQRGIVQLQM